MLYSDCWQLGWPSVDWQILEFQVQVNVFVSENDRRITALTEPCEFTVKRENKVYDVQKAYMGHHHVPSGQNLNSNVQSWIL